MMKMIKVTRILSYGFFTAITIYLATGKRLNISRSKTALNSGLKYPNIENKI